MRNSIQNHIHASSVNFVFIHRKNALRDEALRRCIKRRRVERAETLNFKFKAYVAGVNQADISVSTLAALCPLRKHCVPTPCRHMIYSGYVDMAWTETS